MSIGKGSDFKIYEPQFQAGKLEVYAQNINLMNGASGNTLILRTQLIPGNFVTSSYWKVLSGVVTRRDLTSVAAVSDTPLLQGETSSVKVNRKFGPIAQTLNSFLKLGSDPKEMSIIVGRMYAHHKMRDMANTAIAIVEAAINGQAAAKYTVPTSGTLDYPSLVRGMAKFGDNASNIKAWLMHSKPFFDLMGNSITEKIFGVANITIYNGTIATLGKPTIVTDAPALYHAGAGSVVDTYSTLGLTEGAVEIVESEQEIVVSEVITGLEQLVARIQGEYAFNAEVKGFTWDIANGGANPSDAALATATNWDLATNDVKNIAGIRILSA